MLELLGDQSDLASPETSEVFGDFGSLAGASKGLFSPALPIHSLLTPRLHSLRESPGTRLARAEGHR